MNRPVPSTIVPSMASTHRLTIAMKRRRVIRVTRGSEIGTDREGEGQPAEERVLLRRGVRGGAAASRDLLVLAVGKLHGGDLVPRAHAVEWREPGFVRCLVEEDGAGRSRVRVVPHVHLKGAYRCKDAYPDARCPPQPFQREARQRLHAAAGVSAVPHAAAVEKGGVLNQLRIDRAPNAQLEVRDDE